MKPTTNIDELYELQRSVEWIGNTRRPYSNNKTEQVKTLVNNDIDSEYLYYEPKRPFLRLVR